MATFKLGEVIRCKYVPCMLIYLDKYPGWGYLVHRLDGKGWNLEDNEAIRTTNTIKNKIACLGIKDSLWWVNEASVYIPITN